MRLRVIKNGVLLPAADIADAAVTAGSRIVLVSLTTPRAVTHAEIRRLAEKLEGIELWIGGPAAASVVSAAGDRARLVPALPEVVPMLARHAH